MVRFFLNEIKDLRPEERYGYCRIGRAIVAPGGQEFTLAWKRDVIFSDKPDIANFKTGWPFGSVSMEKRFLKPFARLNIEEKLEYENENLKQYQKIFSLIY